MRIKMARELLEAAEALLLARGKVGAAFCDLQCAYDDSFESTPNDFILVDATNGFGYQFYIKDEEIDVERYYDVSLVK